MKTVSIRTPMKGAISVVIPESALLDVSIRTPMKGAIYRQYSCQRQWQGFNPHAHEGRDEDA